MKLRPWLLPILLSLALSAGAEVYKWVDEQGNVHYGDLPPAGDAVEPITLPGLSTYRSPPTSVPPTEPEPSKAFSGYTKVEITQPAPESVVRANDQRVIVTVQLEPQLQEGHTIAVILDGQAVSGPYPGTSVELTGVYRGQHTLEARVMNAAGQVIARSPPVTFTLRQVSIIK